MKRYDRMRDVLWLIFVLYRYVPMETRRTQAGLTRGMLCRAGCAQCRRMAGRRCRCDDGTLENTRGYSRGFTRARSPLLDSVEVRTAKRTRRATERTTRHLKRD